MSIRIGPPQVEELKPRIAVIGVGGAGGNAIANMIASRVEGVDFVVANTDAQALNTSPAERRIQLGPDITQGLGAGSRPEVGKAAAEETISSIDGLLDGVHMCFIAAGMGGGTGTGAAPVIAKAARDRGILTVGVVTKPFHFEGNRRMRSADAGIEELQANVDTLIVIPNQNLFLVANPNTTFKEAFLMADEVLQQGVRGITDLMVMPGLINLDFADVRSVMHEMGKAMMGTGEADGDGRALEAAQRAIANPLLDGVSMRGAKGVIISITGGEDMRLMEVDEAANHIRDLVDPDANIIWGSAFNENLTGKIRVSVVATGIDADAQGDAPAEAAPRRGFAFGNSAAPRAAAPAVATSFVPSSASAAVVEQEGEAEIAPLTPPEPSFSSAAPAVDADPTPTPGFSMPFGATHDVEDEVDDLVLSEVAQEMEEAAELDAEEDDELVLEAPTAPASYGDETVSETASEPDYIRPVPETADASGSGAGTLFERMSRLSRGLSTNDDDKQVEEDDKIDIPRFLNRQNNQ
jgi:cell division protein FtsZ